MKTTQYLFCAAGVVAVEEGVLLEIEAGGDVSGDADADNAGGGGGIYTS